MEKLNEKNLEYIVGGYENDMPNAKAASTKHITDLELNDSQNDDENSFYSYSEDE